MPRLRDSSKWDWSKIALAAALCIQSFWVGLRTLHMWITGYFLPDELTYFQLAFHSIVLGQREFITSINIALFRLLDINTMSRFVFLFPFYNLFWSSLVLVGIYLITRILAVPVRAAAFVLVSVPFLVANLLMSVAFLTEEPSLALALLGIYFLLRYCSYGGRSMVLLCLATFVLASYSREPYYAFVAGGAMVFAVLTALRKAPMIDALLYVIPALLVVRIPALGFTYLNPPLVLILLNPSLLLSVFSPLAGAVPPASQTGAQLGSSAFSIAALVVSVPRVFFTGLVLGWGPFLFVLAFVSTILRARRPLPRMDATSIALVCMVVTSLGAYLAISSWAAFSYQSQYYLTFEGLATLLRYSHVTIPAYVVLACTLLPRFDKKMLRILFALLLITSLALVPAYVQVSQSSLSSAQVNRFSLDYRAPYYVGLQYLEAHQPSGPALLITNVVLPDQKIVTPYFQPDFNPIFLNYTSGSWDIYLVGNGIPSDTEGMSLTQLGALKPQYLYVLVLKGQGSTVGPNDSVRLALDVSAGNYGIPVSAVPFTMGQTRVVFDTAEGFMTEVNIAYWKGS